MAKCNNTSSCEVCGKRWGCSCQCVEYTVNGETKAICRDCMAKGNVNNSNSSNNSSGNNSSASNSNKDVGIKIGNILVKTIKWK